MSQPNRRPADLSAAEAGVQRWFDALPRAAAPAWEGAPVAAAGATAPRPLFGAWFRPVAAAAAVLFALALPAQGATPAQGPPASTDAHQFEVAVVDDPSVPMLHGLETFDQLACLTDTSGISAGFGPASRFIPDNPGAPGVGPSGAGGR